MNTALIQSSQVAFSALTYRLPELAKKAQSDYLSTIPHYFSESVSTEFIQLAEKLVNGSLTAKPASNELLFSLFEQIILSEDKKSTTKEYVYPYAALSPESIFPRHKDEVKPNYATLWESFVAGLNDIPKSHSKEAENAALYLDHFDTALQCFTSNVPSTYSDEISFYDFSKAVAALTTALSVYHQENGFSSENLESNDALNQPKFLLLQGDFFGIQDFIFSGGSESNKQAAKLLRGRSFQVSLFTELAALKLLSACNLPSTSQIMNAAGKFLIIAPNTERVKKAIESIQQELNQWFITNTYGLVGLGIAVKSASCNDFLGDNFKRLRDGLFKSLEEIKLQRLDLTESTPSVQDISYPYGCCKLNSYFPAVDEKEGLSIISKDQIEIGRLLANKSRIIICNENSEINQNYRTQSLNLSIFGYRIIFTNGKKDTGDFGYPVKLNQIQRFWDFSLAENTTQPIWNGYARRYINAYVPYFKETDKFVSEKYKGVENEIDPNSVKTFDFIASEDRQLQGEKYQGQVALMTLKGDVDNLGKIFEKGFNPPNLAKMSGLSRLMNQFFSLWLPAYCAEKSPNMYTVFAGGDDFFLIGSWYSTQKVAYAMRQRFIDYVAKNPEIHFSAGMVMTKVGMPVPRLGELAEDALEKAKGVEGKNAVTIYHQAVAWDKWQSLSDLEDEIERLAREYRISTSYLYSLIYFAKQANEKDKIENTMWRSRFYYKTARYVVDKLSKERKDKALEEISISLGEKGIEQHKLDFIIPLFNHFYKQR